jgi:NADPH:quinone reductase
VPIEGRYSFAEPPGLIARLGGEIMGRHIIKVQ